MSHNNRNQGNARQLRRASRPPSEQKWTRNQDDKTAADIARLTEKFNKTRDPKYLVSAAKIAANSKDFNNSAQLYEQSAQEHANLNNTVGALVSLHSAMRQHRLASEHTQNKDEKLKHLHSAFHYAQFVSDQLSTEAAAECKISKKLLKSDLKFISQDLAQLNNT